MTSPRALIAAAVAALIASAVGCGDGPLLPSNRCVAGWPGAAGEEGEAGPRFVPAPPLDGVEPGVLWTSRVTTAGVNDWLLLNGDRVAFAAGGSLYLLDRDGNYLGRTSSTGREGVTSAVVGRDGNFYMVGYSVYSVSPDGDLRWVTPLPDDDGRFPRARGRLVADPGGGLYFGADDGYLYAVEAADGRLRWRTRVSGDGERPPAVMTGGGDAVVAIARDGGPKPQLYSTATGEPIAHFDGPRGERFVAMFGRDLGIVTQRMEDRGGAYPWMHITVLDACAHERWRIDAQRPQWPALIGADDRLYVTERDDVEGSATFTSVYDVDGARVAGPVATATPWGLGADGTLYAVACDSSGYDGPSRLYAYDQDLNQQWMLPLGDACPMVGPVIDDQGRLYLGWYRDRATEIIAIQTRSPGLADTSWPTRRRDPRGTGWLQ
ncbi:PQQ-binding-like beta-propeller repeat protein [Haliangium sp.]|uniref:outer membrane protein assembly factor BamB family protein n=1 Tax=Haliangium sp. TaxID=2663208 RepID=UPI003D0CEBBD